jgi:hypothetical protein
MSAERRTYRAVFVAFALLFVASLAGLAILLDLQWPVAGRQGIELAVAFVTIFAFLSGVACAIAAIQWYRSRGVYTTEALEA